MLYEERTSTDIATSTKKCTYRHYIYNYIDWDTWHILYALWFVLTTTTFVCPLKHTEDILYVIIIVRALYIKIQSTVGDIIVYTYMHYEGHN